MKLGKATKIILWLAALVLVSNFIVLRMYGDTLQSTHLFIVRGTVFYPLSWLNLIFGILLLVILVREQIKKPKK